MTTIFLVLAIVGGGVTLLQLVASLLGLDADHDFAPDSIDGLHLLSVRALSAGALFGGLCGLLGLYLDWLPSLATVLALLGGLAGAIVVASLFRSLRRMETDGTIRLEDSVGEIGEVYLSVPANLTGRGKIFLALQGRTVEVQARTTADQRLLPQQRVIVIDVLGDDEVEVMPVPPELLHTL